jgi:transposase
MYDGGRGGVAVATMTAMTTQPPLPLLPAQATLIGVGAAGLVEDEEGGRVWLHGQLAYLWDAGDEVARRLAAVQLVKIKAATAAATAAAFGVSTVTLWRWTANLTSAGAVGLRGARPGPKGPSKLSEQVVGQIRDRRKREQSLRQIATAVGVSTASVRRALAEPAENGAGGGAEDQDYEENEESAEPGESCNDVDGRASHHTDAASASEEEPGESDQQVTAPLELPVLAEPSARTAERGLARWGLLAEASPVFVPAARVPLAGLLLAIPALEATGLLGCAKKTYGALPNGFYGLHTVLTEAVLRTLAGEPRAEGASRIDPVTLGRVLGLDRAPEVKTIRRKLAQLATRRRGSELVAALARHHLDQAQHNDPELAAVLYVDGHVRVYHGRRKIAKTHVARLKFPAPATAETWITDAAGAPVLVVTATPGASLAAELRRLLPDLRAAIGDQRRVLVGFDRGGWSPALFAHMAEAGFDVLTWRKAPVVDVDDEEFTTVTFTDEYGLKHSWQSAESLVNLPLDKNGEEVFEMRQVTRRDEPGGKQVHILTTRSIEELSTGEINYRMSARWRVENFFRYARAHYDLDSLDSYAVGADDQERMVPNPAKKRAHAAVLAARAAYDRARAATDHNLLALRSPQPGTTAVITNTDHDAATQALRAAAEELDAAQAAHRAIPTRLPLGQVNPGQQLLETQTKLITHAVKMAAFNTVIALVRDLRTHTDYARAGDEAHALIRQVLTGSGDIDPDPDAGTLTVRLDPLPTARATRAIAQLCERLTDTQTRFPGTELMLRYQIKPRR